MQNLLSTRKSKTFGERLVIRLKLNRIHTYKRLPLCYTGAFALQTTEFELFNKTPNTKNLEQETKHQSQTAMPSTTCMPTVALHLKESNYTFLHSGTYLASIRCARIDFYSFRDILHCLTSLPNKHNFA